ncbi:MAG: hypothetical protein ACE5IW_11045 [bacterium]
MGNTISFGQVLEAADKLSLEEQETLIGILHRRMIERRREELAQDIKEAQKEFREGKCKPVTVDQLMKEMLS